MFVVDSKQPFFELTMSPAFDVLISEELKRGIEARIQSRQPIMMPLRMGDNVGKTGHFLLNLLEDTIAM